MSTPLRWLHLSDFHIGQDTYGQGKIAQYILEHVEQHRQSPLDFIFITGDIGFSGQAEEYALFQEKFVEPMQKLLGPDTQWWIVPGNHDVNRQCVKRLDRQDFLKDKNAVFEPTDKGLTERQLLLSGLQHYRQQIQYPAPDWLASKQGVFHWSGVCRGIKLGILGINTAWLCKDDQDQGHLTPGKSLVEEGLSQIAGCAVKIVLGHHPVDHWQKEDRQSITALFRRNQVLYLHGHLHETEIEQDTQFISLQAGAAFQGRESKQWKNRLLWGELDLQQLRLSPYVWAAQHQSWTLDSEAFHPDCKITGEDQWAFAMPVIAKPSPTVTCRTQTQLAEFPPISEDCFGREAEYKALDQALAEEKTNVFSLVAWGGEGKTTLLGHWLQQLQKDGYRGLQRVFAWSFYSQGSAEDRQASSDLFIEAALRWCGEDATSGSLWDKGGRLAASLCRQPTLLILDGLEPLQYPPGEMQGRLKDQGMQALLRELSYAQAGWGLCVVTTRLAVADMLATTGGAVQTWDVEALSSKAGVTLLQAAEVNGSADELAAAVQAYAGHALALTLLGSYLRVVHQGDIRKRDLIPALTDEPNQGGHAKRVLASYERWLSAADKALLYLLGLFDRPASKDALLALREPPLAGIGDSLTSLQWPYSVQHLRDLKLLAAADPNHPEYLDCQPLVRAYCSEQLRTKHPERWQAAHHRLYGYYQAIPEKQQPDTLAELEPLYRAVAHGCLAGCVQEVKDKVYEERIGRNEHYSVNKLGAFGPDLAAVAYFFEVAWSKPSAALTEADQAWVLSLAGSFLRALGRLREAIEPLSTAMQRRVKQKDWKNAAISAKNLSELQLTLGQLASAVKMGRQGVEYANQREDWVQRMTSRTALANALFQSGDSAAAERLFRAAEAIQKAEQPHNPTLYSLPGYQFCELLLETTDDKSIHSRATAALQIAKRNHWLLDTALDHLSLGRHALQQTQQQNSNNFQPALMQLHQAVAGLRQAGYQYYLPQGLLARAACLRAQGNYSAAQKDLQEAQDIAERGEMKLHLTDYHLEAARLCQAQGLDFAVHTEKAKTLIAQTGYHRRDKELAAITAHSPPPIG